MIVGMMDAGRMHAGPAQSCAHPAGGAADRGAPLLPQQLQHPLLQDPCARTCRHLHALALLASCLHGHIPLLSRTLLALRRAYMQNVYGINQAM